MSSETVQAWSETVFIPTYPAGSPDKNPMFLEKRVYQGSSGVVYPHPVIDHIKDERVEASYTAVFLENSYLKIMILPELGGRVQMALDKTNGYHFVYYNRVIKPALVGLAGPWISGGIEFNWPQHHRPSTFDPLDWCIDELPDGSKTIWCTEIERMFHTKGMHGFTLRPERAVLEIQVQLYNRTSQPQTFLWWANPAVHVNDDYQSVFPPDVHAVMDHGKRDVSDFPIATGVYYKMNYAPGTDISRYKNIPVPTSYMAYHSDFDFVGDYDHGKQAGMMHVANHHIVPGKKQWTWGCGDFGQSWDRQLTDEDGPYIELMCGAYTDNQPDFSWIMPGEEKRFEQAFLPYKKIGPASNASKEVVLRLDVQGEQAEIGIYVTEPRTVTVEVWKSPSVRPYGSTEDSSTGVRGQADEAAVIFTRTLPLDPENVLLETVPLGSPTRPQAVTLRVLGEDGRELLSFTPLPDEKPEIPPPATPARDPQAIETNEELYLNGLHLEQYRHATYAPEPYYLEALRRDPGDSRCNNAMGLLLYRRGKFAEAEPYFRAATRRLTQRNPNPYDGEPYYNLGLSLKMQGRYTEAYTALYKAVWNAAWQSPGYFELARLAARAGRLEEALDLAQHSLLRGWTNHRARHLKIALLRRLVRIEAARREIDLALSLDHMEYGALWEMHIITGDNTFERYTENDFYTCAAIAIDYAHAGLFEEAIDLLRAAPQENPLVHYYAGWIHDQAARRGASGSGQSGPTNQAETPTPTALAAFQRAASLPADYVFPNTLESVLALQAAIRWNPGDPRAPYYLGNFWYAHRRYDEAVECWERAAVLDPTFPTVFRNLGLAYANKRGDLQQALEAYETAYRLNPDDARVFFELDQLSKKLNLLPPARLARLEARRDLVDRRDDLTVEYLNLLLITGRAREALDILTTRRFHPWEGGEGKTTGAYVTALVELARQYIEQDRAEEALDLLERARVYPHNLGEGKLHNALENHIFYYMGIALTSLGRLDEARAAFTKASTGLSEPTSAMYYNDQPPHMIFYQGLALRALSRDDEAREVFEMLTGYGKAHLDDEIKMDYFAVSLPDFLVFEEDLTRRNRIHSLHMMALGCLGLNEHEQARQAFDQILQLDANHTGAYLHRRLLTSITR